MSDFVLGCNNGLGGFRQNLVNLATRYECLCVCLYVCEYLYVRASVKRFRMFLYVRASGRRVMRVRMCCLYVHAFVCACVCMCMHVCAHVSVCACMCVRMCLYVHACVMRAL